LRPARGAVLALALLLSACAGDPPAAPPTGGAADARGTPTSSASRAPSPQPADTEGGPLLQSLKRGGHVIFFRHAATVPGGDSDLQNLSNCAAQRNLSDRGRQQSEQIGAAFRRLAIPVDRVLSSALCRTVDTATLAFGRAEQTLDLTSLPQAGNDAEEQRRIEALRRLLSTAPPPGQNTVLVGHLFNIQRAAEISLAEGEAAVFAPRGEGRFEVVDTVSPEEWEALDQIPQPAPS